MKYFLDICFYKFLIMKIVLLGYMGSGKSTIGKNLAEKLQLPFLDLDNYIEEQEKATISEIFKLKGEIYFRKKEAAYLIDILNKKENYVLSLGGGTPCYANSINEILNSNAECFYLKASIKTLFNRLRNTDNSRPLIESFTDDQLFEYLGKHLFERAPFYEQAKNKISVDDIVVEQVVKNIIGCLH